MSYRMQFIRLVEIDPETATPHGERDEGLVNATLRTYRPLPNMPGIVLRAADLESAKAEAAAYWEGIDRSEAPDVEGYWILDETGERAHVHHDQRDADLKLANARSH